MAQTSNPLQGFYRAPKLYTSLPSMGKFYSEEIIEMPENGELPIFPMTSKDEMIMKNPDALLNGEAVAQVIKSCVPAVKQPRKLLSNDVDTLLIAMQGATNGDEVDVNAKCPECGEEVSAVRSIESALESMTTLEETYSFATDNGLVIEVRPFTYESSVKAGIANFQTTRSVQSIQTITDEMQQLKAFNTNFIQIAALNFDLMVDSVASIKGKDAEGDEFVVTDSASIREFMENCDSTIGKKIEEEIAVVNAKGVNKSILLECEKCENQFEQEINFDPVNFFTAS